MSRTHGPSDDSEPELMDGITSGNIALKRARHTTQADLNVQLGYLQQLAADTPTGIRANTCAGARFGDAMASAADTLDQEDEDIIMTDFEIKALEDHDFHGIRQLLKQLFHTAMGEHLSAWTELILSQWEYVGSTFKIVDQNEVYGVVTVINLTHHAGLPCIVALKDHLLANCPPDTRSKLARRLDDTTRPLGLLVHERFANLPFDLVGPSYNILLSELTGAMEEQDPNHPFELSDILIYAKAYTQVASQTASLVTKRASDGSLLHSCTYINPEDELFASQAHLKYSIRIDYSETEKHKLVLTNQWVQLQRKVILLPMPSFKSLAAGISEPQTPRA